MISTYKKTHKISKMNIIKKKRSLNKYFIRKEQQNQSLIKSKTFYPPSIKQLLFQENFSKKDVESAVEKLLTPGKLFELYQIRNFQEKQLSNLLKEKKSLKNLYSNLLNNQKQFPKKNDFENIERPEEGSEDFDVNSNSEEKSPINEMYEMRYIFLILLMKLKVYLINKVGI